MIFEIFIEMNFHSLVRDNIVEVSSGVFLSSIRIPAGLSNSFSRDGSPLGVCNRRPNISTIILASKSRMNRGVSIAVSKMSVSNAIGEVIGGILLSSIAIPASVTVGLSRNVSPLGVSNSNKDGSSTIVLVSTGHSPESRRRNSVSDVAQWMNNPREVVGGVFFSSIRIPAVSSLGFSRNVTMLSVS